MANQEPVTIRYSMSFENGKRSVIEVKVDPKTVEVIHEGPQPPPPDWAKLDFAPCDGCPLDKTRFTHCPVAVNLSTLVEQFRQVLSYQEVDIMVETENRTIAKHITVQEAVASLVGLYMVCSACPTMGKLKPLARFHLPFSGVEETVYRVITMYVTAQYLRMQRGLNPDWDMSGLHAMYEDISKVNAGIVRRLQDAARQDAILNSIVQLDLFAAAIKRPTPERVEALLQLFAPYLK